MIDSEKVLGGSKTISQHLDITSKWKFEKFESFRVAEEIALHSKREGSTSFHVIQDFFDETLRKFSLYSFEQIFPIVHLLLQREDHFGILLYYADGLKLYKPISLIFSQLARS